MKKLHKIALGCILAPFLIIGLIVFVAIVYFSISNYTNGRINNANIDNARILLYVDKNKDPHDGDIEYIAIIDESTVYVKENGKEKRTSVKSTSDVHGGLMGISLSDGSLIVLKAPDILAYNKYGNTQLYRLDINKSKW